MNDARSAVSAAVKHVLDHEAKRNEVRVAVVRLAGYTAVLGIDVVTGALGLRPVSNIAQSLACALTAAAILWALERAPIRDWYKLAIPVMDGAMLALILHPRIAQLGPSTGLIATTALTCGLFSATGALRFQRRWSLWTTFLAGVLLVVIVGPYAQAHEMVYALASLAAVGLLAMWLSDLVRRSMEGAGSRALLQRFLPRELVDSAFADPLAAFGEARVVDATVLMSDLRGFTALSERQPPARVFAFLSQLQGELAQIVQANGGIVDKFLGDGMLAVFGVDGAPDHAARAVRAAGEIVTAIERLSLSNPLDADSVRIGIGVHAGPLVAGCLGTGDRLEWTIIGDTVNTASRLESLTKEKGVTLLVSEAVVAQIPGADFVPLGQLRVRGREQPLGVHHIPAAADLAYAAGDGPRGP